jgi:hypothetical protein
MVFVKIENGLVVQKQPFSSSGFIEAFGDVVCGMLYDGKDFTSPIAPTKVPDVVDMAGARVALIRAGLLSAVEQAVSLAGPEAIALWEYRGTIRRDHPLVQQLKKVVPLTEQQLDELFITAASV